MSATCQPYNGGVNFSERTAEQDRIGFNNKGETKTRKVTFVPKNELNEYTCCSKINIVMIV